MTDQRPDPPAPSLTFVFQARVTVGAALELGVVDGVQKRIFPVTGGAFSGPWLNGRVLPGGADWQSVLPDGSAKIFARYTLQADDGTLIAITNPGMRNGPREILQRLAAGEMVDPSLYYFRTSPSFEVGAGAHHWLSQAVFVCNAARHSDHVQLEFFKVN